MMVGRTVKNIFFGPVRILLVALLILAAQAGAVKAVDPPYQPEMERLIEILGSLYFLQPLCGFKQNNWRAEAGELIALEQPTDDRRQRLTGAFNDGYQYFARTYISCTPSALEAMVRFLVEAEESARDIHTRFAE